MTMTIIHYYTCVINIEEEEEEGLEMPVYIRIYHCHTPYHGHVTKMVLVCEGDKTHRHRMASVCIPATQREANKQ